MSPLEYVLKALIIFTALLTTGLLAFVSLYLIAGALVEVQRLGFERSWQPVLYAWMDGEKAALPALPQRHALWLLRLWNRTLNYVEGEAADFLRQFAAEAHLADHAGRMLGARAAWQRLLAVITLGELRSAPHWTWLRPLLADPHLAVVLAAVEAMVRIDARRAAPEVIPALLAQSHWDPVRTGRLLRGLGSQAIPPLQAALAAARPGSAERTLRWLGLTGQVEALEPLRARLANASVGEIAVILEAFGRLGGAEERSLVLKYITNADWRVRMQAGRALGELGLVEDRAALEALLVDPVWWVRYRAAGALLKLRGESIAHFRMLADQHDDRYARDALQRVLAETGAA